MHQLKACGLHARGKPLPEWGFKQDEITCGKETLRSNMVWLIESNEHPMAAKQEGKQMISFRKMGFWGKFWELNERMWRTNAGLSADHPFASRPESWPLLSRGLGFWNGNHVPKTEQQHKEHKRNKGKNGGEGNDSGDDSGDDLDTKPAAADEEELKERERLETLYKGSFKGQQIYLIGNPVVWWLSTAMLGLYCALVMTTRLLKKRGIALPKGTLCFRFDV